MKNYKMKKGFTIAEVMVVVVVMGVIAVMTVPNVIKKYQEAQARTKIKRSMAAYDTAINKMVIENELKSKEALNQWADANNCSNSTQYFKKSQGEGCIFKTSDGVWWDISDVTHPVVSLTEINEENKNEIREKANDPNYDKAFVLVSNFDENGSLRVDDLAFEKKNLNDSDSEIEVIKLFNLVGSYNDDCDKTCQYLRGDFSKNCNEGNFVACTQTRPVPCIAYMCPPGDDSCEKCKNAIRKTIYDTKGNVIGQVNSSKNSSIQTSTIYNVDGSISEITYNTENGTYCRINKDSENNEISRDGEYCSNLQ